MRWAWDRRGRYSRARKIARTGVYPLALVLSTISIGVIASDSAAVSKSLPFGPVLFAMAVSTLVLSIVRIGDGSLDLQNGKQIRSGGRYAASFWLTAFVTTCAAVLVFLVIDRLPEKVDWPSNTARQGPGPSFQDQRDVASKEPRSTLPEPPRPPTKSVATGTSPARTEAR